MQVIGKGSKEETLNKGVLSTHDTRKNIHLF